MKRSVLSLLLLTVTLAAAAFGQVTKTGTTAGKFLSVGVGAKANAMGGAFSAVANDASALYWNPAGIASFTRYQGGVTHTSLYENLGIQLNYLALVLPAGDVGNFGLSATVLDYGEMEVTTELYPEGIGEKFTAASYAFGFSYANQITDNFSAGGTIKYIRETILNSSADGVAFDVGTIFKTPFYGVVFSSIITNYGGKLQMSGDDLLIRYDSDEQREGNNETVDAYYKTDRFELPLKLQIGISRQFDLFNGQRLTVAVDATHPNDNVEYVNIGGELSLLENLVSFRGGYRALFLGDNQEGLTFGAGLHQTLGVFSIGVDYAYQKYAYLGATHTFGVAFEF
ncbi:MAG: PorV/PorQ family protein [Nitrososphaera sp.]|nr:PorV/PorQ family protein [Nitrososphaera sp.]MCI0707143.1 PorV/PorQ family protein [Ignavibacteriota bacterium]